MGARIFVFLGPSLPAQERQMWARDPSMQVLPPVAAGDLLRLPAQAGDVVGIADGLFRGQAPVRHKEILHLLDRGVRVHGAASMGALRAAELEAFGMVGHGRIFRDYRAGTLVADDEVALLHGTAEEDYQPYTEALVNVRHALAGAVAVGIISTRVAEAVIAAGRRLPFTERTRHAILATTRGLDDNTAHIVQQVLDRGEDLKRRDASELLHALSLDDGSAILVAQAPRKGWRLERTSYLGSWQALAAGEAHPEAGFIPDTQVHDFCRIQAGDYPAFHERVALTALLTGPTPFPGEGKAHEPTSTYPGGWGPDPAGAEVAEPHHAVIRRLRTLGLVSGTLRGEEGWQRWCTRAETGLAPHTRIAKAATRACFPNQTLTCSNPFLAALRAEGYFTRAKATLVHILLFNQRLADQHPGLEFDRLSVTRIHHWYAQRWARQNDFDDAALERGYATAEQFTTAARPFYLHDKHCRDCPPFILGTPAQEPA
ncbi:TfuA-like protein [Streptomyces sp. NPDC002659]|uniref:TfuA-like protein n=1 Tax=Streptomyces sp. NPDC002659 TaxID=3364656 RepID=UPI0036BB38AD